RVPAHAAQRQARSVSRRTVRRAGRDHARRDAGVAGQRARGGAADRGARDPRRRGGVRAGRPRVRDVAAAGPDRRRAARGARAPAQGDRPGAGRTARARAGGAAVIAPVVLLALFIGGWELYTRVSNVDAFILPAPHEVAQSLYDDRSLLLSNLSVTAQEVGLGVVL